MKWISFCESVPEVGREIAIRDKSHIRAHGTVIIVGEDFLKYATGSMKLIEGIEYRTYTFPMNQLKDPKNEYKYCYLDATDEP